VTVFLLAVETRDNYCQTAYYNSITSEHFGFHINYQLQVLLETQISSLLLKKLQTKAFKFHFKQKYLNLELTLSHK